MNITNRVAVMTFRIQILDKDGNYQSHGVVVEADLAEIARMLGPRAVKSKGGRAIECGGRVKVRRGVV